MAETAVAQSVRAAGPGDAAAIRALVHAAYRPYVERIGRPPAPMLTDYEALVGEAAAAAGNDHDAANDDDAGEGGGGLEVWVLRVGGDGADAAAAVAGAVVLRSAPDEAGALQVNNLVVDPAMQGRGYGRRLMELAEARARARGRPRLVLYTNVLMWENVALYGRWGFVETGRRREDGYERVYFAKDLAAAEA